jgi:hypothetical protein
MGYIRKAIAKGISKEYKKQILSDAIGMEKKKVDVSGDRKKIFKKKVD